MSSMVNGRGRGKNRWTRRRTIDVIPVWTTSRKQTNRNRMNDKQMNEGSLGDPWDRNKRTWHLHRQGPQRERRKRAGLKKILEEMGRLPNFVKGENLNIREAKRIPNGINPKKSSPRHRVVTLLRTKHEDSIFKAAREKLLIPSLYGRQAQRAVGYSPESQRTEGSGSFSSVEKKKRTRKKTKILYAVKISFRNAGEVKAFLDKEKQNFLRAYLL